MLFAEAYATLCKRSIPIIIIVRMCVETLSISSYFHTAKVEHRAELDNRQMWVNLCRADTIFGDMPTKKWGLEGILCVKKWIFIFDNPKIDVYL